MYAITALHFQTSCGKYLFRYRYSIQRFCFGFVQDCALGRAPFSYLKSDYLFRTLGWALFSPLQKLITFLVTVADSEYLAAIISSFLPHYWPISLKLTWERFLSPNSPSKKNSYGGFGWHVTPWICHWFYSPLITCSVMFSWFIPVIMSWTSRILSPASVLALCCRSQTDSAQILVRCCVYLCVL